MKLRLGLLLTVVLFFSSSSFADTLTLHFYPSPHGINWKSPSKLAFSTLINMVSKKDKGMKRMIGHASIELSCGATSETEAIHIMRGSSAAYNGEREKLLKNDKVGLGILFYDMLGRQEKAENLEPKLSRRLEKGRNSFVEYQISPETCQRLYQYSLEYEARGYHQHYGLPNRPRHGEGAGCTAFVISYLSVAGLMEEEYQKAWSKTIRVPEPLVGGELTGKKVSILNLLLTPLRWAKEHQDHFKIFFWDPDAMHRWVKKVHNAQGKYGGLQFETTRYGKSKGLTLDVRHVPTPTDPFFYD